MRREDGSVLIEGARIIRRNFSGREELYNPAGKRNILVLLEDDQLVKDMIQDGWNVKTLKPREEGEEPGHAIKVTIAFKARPPKVVMITSKNRTALGLEEIGMLDFVRFKLVDLIFVPYKWTVERTGEEGISAYLKTMYVTIDEDELELKYAEDLPAGQWDDE